ncbi:MAG: hypothetical protein MI799_06305 [Desulfobacterales bacterium]|nr:hypothetical protein [Desulfobacterales bacterium]
MSGVKQQVFKGFLFWGILLISVFCTRAAWAGDDFKVFSPVELNGFLEFRAGCRIQDDPRQKQTSVLESRLQAELFTYTSWAEFKYKGDLWADGITEKGEYDTREAWMFARPSDVLDIKIGRQVLTWGTGDLVFLNDLFPKDWQSYFIGRDSEYLKAPSDAVKVSFFTSFANVDLVYTPRFDPDRYITGEYVSYWNGSELAGRDNLINTQVPDQWFKDYEIALRLYKNIRNYELALYGYRGFWKRPSGRSGSGEYLFPELSVYGFSARGNVGRGIGNLEFAYYRSGRDSDGTDPMINNSELRYLVGYNQDLAMDFNAGLQYYVEQMLHYGSYEDNLVQGAPRDRFRHVITLQLTWLLMNQNLELSLSSYWSPSDQDAYLRPRAAYKWSDDITVEAGANIFTGSEMHTFFGQFEDNTSVYTAVRFSL